MNSPIDVARGAVDDFAVYFSHLSPGVQSAVYAVIGLVLTGFAVPKFEYEPISALAYIALAVFLFWMAAARFM
jgi:hypothetical protein